MTSTQTESKNSAALRGIGAIRWTITSRLASDRMVAKMLKELREATKDGKHIALVILP